MTTDQPTCKSCQWWRKIARQRRGICSRSGGHNGMSAIGERFDIKRGAWIATEQGCAVRAHITTSGKFSCIHHTPRAETEG